MSSASILNRVPSENDNYPAAQLLLDDAVDQAVREEYPSGPQWMTEQEPLPEPKAPPVVHVLDLAGTSLRVERFGTKAFFVTLINCVTIQTSETDARDQAVQIARSWLQEALSAIGPGAEGSANHSQPSVTAATSADLVKEYAGKEVSP